MKLRPNWVIAAALFTVVLVARLFMPPTPADGATARAETTKSNGANASNIRVIDGDTFEDTRADVTYRIVNIDTPETGSRARCVAERALGDRATRATRRLVANAREFQARSTGRIDSYGRTIAYVRIDGRDLGELLIADGLARPWRGRREPWCNGSGNLIR